MLSKRRCPHTGVINFYSSEDPFLAIASVVKVARANYHWRFYADPCAGAGTTRDLGSAEALLRDLNCQVERHDFQTAVLCDAA